MHSYLQTKDLPASTLASLLQSSNPPLKKFKRSAAGKAAAAEQGLAADGGIAKVQLAAENLRKKKRSPRVSSVFCVSCWTGLDWTGLDWTTNRPPFFFFACVFFLRFGRSTFYFRLWVFYFGFLTAFEISRGVVGGLCAGVHRAYSLCF